MRFPRSERVHLLELRRSECFRIEGSGFRVGFTVQRIDFYCLRPGFRVFTTVFEQMVPTCVVGVEWPPTSKRTPVVPEIG